MANEFYITAGLPAIDSATIANVGTNAFYITAGLVANDYAAGGSHYTEGVAGTECFTGAIARKYMGDRLLTGNF